MADKKLVRSEPFPGKIEHFQALMARLGIQHLARWKSSSGEELWFVPRERGNPKHWAWHIEIPVPFRDGKRGPAIGNAGIEAYELSHGITQIDFWDGYFAPNPAVRRPAIGPTFEEFCEMIVSEMRRWIEEHLDASKPARAEAAGEAVGDLVRQWKADKVTDLDLLRGLSELEIDVLKLPGIHQDTSSKPAKQAELLDLARRYITAKQYDLDTLRSDIGSERTVSRGVALYKAIEKLA